MLLQYSQTVCTLLDHLKTTFAPQLGQLETGWVIGEDPGSVVLRFCRTPFSRLPRARVAWCRSESAAEPKPSSRQRFRAAPIRNSTPAAARSKKRSSTTNHIRG